jgi:hypothetical protein
LNVMEALSLPETTFTSPNTPAVFTLEA